MRLFFDTNFIFDLLIREDYRDVANELISKANTRGYDFYISYLSAANFAYIIRKSSLEDRLFYLNKINEIFDFIENNQEQFLLAMRLKTDDFEDALQYQAALAAECDCIITRNQKDFIFSEIPVYTPKEFVEKFLG